MTVKEMIEYLQTQPQNAVVKIWCDGCGDPYTCGGACGPVTFNDNEDIGLVIIEQDE